MMTRGFQISTVVVAGVLIAGAAGTPSHADPWYSGDTFYSTDGLVFEDTDGLLMMRKQGKKMCFTEPMGYTFIGKRVTDNAYRGVVHGPQWNTRQRASVRFERVNGDEAVTIKSRGVQPFGPDFFYRVSRADLSASQFGKKPTRTLNIACVSDA